MTAGTSGKNLLHLPTEIGRRDTGFALESMGEVGLLIESELIADLGNRLAGSQKQVLRLGELARLDNLRNALMDHVLTDENEVAKGHSAPPIDGGSS